MKEIDQISIEGIGRIFSSDGKIKQVDRNIGGERIAFYQQGNREWQIKYVIEIKYKD